MELISSIIKYLLQLITCSTQKPKSEMGLTRAPVFRGAPFRNHCTYNSLGLESEHIQICSSCSPCGPCSNYAHKGLPPYLELIIIHGLVSGREVQSNIPAPLIAISISQRAVIQESPESLALEAMITCSWLSLTGSYRAVKWARSPSSQITGAESGSMKTGTTSLNWKWKRLLHFVFFWSFHPSFPYHSISIRFSSLFLQKTDAQVLLFDFPDNFNRRWIKKVSNRFEITSSTISSGRLLRYSSSSSTARALASF